MRISTTTSVSAVALAAVAVLGASYAGAAPSPAASSPRASAVGTSLGAATSGGTLQEIASARPNIAYLYSTDDISGNDQVTYTVPNPPKGYYHASFTANFFPQGTPSAPATFSCWLLKNGQMRTQSTVSTTYDSGFYAGANGANSVKVNPGDTFEAGCGTADGTDWQYGSRSLQVSFTRIDGLVNVPLNKTAQKSGSDVAATR